MALNRARGCDGSACGPAAMVAAAVIVGLVSMAGAQLNAPFPIGYSMGNGGAITSSRGISCHQPWEPASLSDDSLRWGISAAGVQYYDHMDNLGERRLVDGALGGWYASRWATVKCAIQQFNALGIYFEQSAVLSVGTRLIPWVNLSLEAAGRRAGIRQYGTAARTTAEAGASIRIPRRSVAFSAGVKHLRVKSPPVQGLSEDPAVSVGIHTDTRLAGAQGVVSEVIFTPGSGPRVRFLFGEEYWFHPRFGLSAGLTTEPLMFSFGVTFLWAGFGGNVSFVRHPVLGWSKGFMIDWAG